MAEARRSSSSRILGRRSKLRFESAFESLADGFTICEAVRDPSGRLLDYRIINANASFLATTGHGPSVIGCLASELVGPVPGEWLRHIHHVLHTGEVIRFEYQATVSSRWYEVHCTRVSEKLFSHLFIDITNRKKLESEIAQQLDELNHRVKNNLAIVASMLTLQGRAAAPQVKQQLSSAVDRIHAVEQLHADLYLHSSCDRIELGSYLGELTSNLRRSLLLDERFTLVFEPIELHVHADLALRLGLLVNELVTNAAKYAYPEPAHGAITVRMLLLGPELVLSVSDYGVGLPPPGESSSGLGMRVINSLVQQCGGALKIIGHPGATFEIAVPKVGGSEPAPARQQQLL